MKGPPKFAFIAGCGAYHPGKFERLEAAVNDVVAMHAKCQENGFEVHSCSDVSRDNFQENLEHATRRVNQDTKIIIFHWSGHATSESSRPVLHPSFGGSIDLAEIIQQLSRKASPRAATIVILDCCRDMQMQEIEKAVDVIHEKIMPEFTPEVRTQGIRGKLCRYRQLIYIQACAPGRHATEERGAKGHGHLTKAILDNLFKDESLAEVFDSIKAQVLKDTCNKQDAWISDNCCNFLSTWGNPLLYRECCFKLAREASDCNEKNVEKKMKELEDKHRVELEGLRKKCVDEKLALQQEKRELTVKHGEELEDLRQKCGDDYYELQQKNLMLETQLFEKQASTVFTSADTSRRRTSTSSSVGSSIMSSPSRFPSIVDGSLNTLLERRRKPWIVIDGVPGVGKSLLADAFKEDVEPKMHVICEPIDSWEEQLALYYGDQKKHAFTTNMMILQHHLKTADLIAASDNKRGVISERSPLSQVKIFAEISHDSGELTDTEFKIIKQFLGLLQDKDPPCMPTHYVLLEASADTCLQRLKKRGRPYEQHEGMQKYLDSVSTKLQDTYKAIESKMEMNLAYGAHVIRISAEGSPKEVRKVFLENMSHLWSDVRLGN